MGYITATVDSVVAPDAVGPADVGAKNEKKNSNCMNNEKFLLTSCSWRRISCSCSIGCNRCCCCYNNTSCCQLVLSIDKRIWDINDIHMNLQEYWYWLLMLVLLSLLQLWRVSSSLWSYWKLPDSKYWIPKTSDLWSVLTPHLFKSNSFY